MMFRDIHPIFRIYIQLFRMKYPMNLIYSKPGDLNKVKQNMADVLVQ